MNNNLKCLVDKKAYKYCPSCDSDKNKPSWYSLFCCENCKDIFMTLRDNSLGKITDENAKEELKKLDLSKQKEFDKEMRDQINKLLNTLEENNVEDTHEAVEKVNVVDTVVNDVKKFGKKIY